MNKGKEMFILTQEEVCEALAQYIHDKKDRTVLKGSLSYFPGTNGTVIVEVFPDKNNRLN